ncbi:MAG: phenylalanine--tRNA ligase subunit beta [Gammaproteobacteria bacterium]|nr:phenylalanine--tRNA ligase subunit beta [Gammaproteobacteria bacterium]
MKISEQWLREWVAPRLDTRALADRLTLAGLEVGTIAPAAPALERVVVGKILAVAPHPQADRLRVCQVDAGQDRPLTIVCGAANAAAGLRVPVALVGARLPGGAEIKHTEIRGVASAGMLCSAAELGLEEKSEGLWELDGNLKPGVSLTSALALDDQVLEIELTPNRGDCLSVAGVARELAALTGARLKAPVVKDATVKSKKRLSVTLAAKLDCPHYAGRVIEGLDPAARTPVWMQERLRRAGIRCIQPVVDVTNYVMLELGQPMHAFDLARLSGGIVVRHARVNETLALLDGKSLALEPGTLVIADRHAPVAIAGIMGGLVSGVTAATTAVFLESAYFRPETIARRARGLGLHSESSHRFERGVDPRLQRRALQRATNLLLAIAGGRAGPITEQTAPRHVPKRAAIRLRSARVARLLGMSLSVRSMSDTLKRLGMRAQKTVDGLRVTPPSYRFDIARECDLIEELARVVGYERVPSTRPPIAMAASLPSESDLDADRLRAVLMDRDYHEAITYSFVDPALQALLDPQAAPALLANPIAADMAAMRTQLWPGLLTALTYNCNRQQARIRLFEIGPRFIPGPKGVRQEWTVAGVLHGPAAPEQWGVPARALDFYDLKGDVEALLSVARAGFETRAAQHPALHPGQCAAVYRRGTGEGDSGGLFGRLHPAIQAKLGLEQPVFLFELGLAGLASGAIPRFREISKYPSVRRDLAVVVDRATPARAVLECVAKAAGDLLANLELFDEYRGEGIDFGRKSLALALTLQDSSRTLNDEAAEAVIQRVVAALGSELGAQLRQ